MVGNTSDTSNMIRDKFGHIKVGGIFIHPDLFPGLAEIVAIIFLSIGFVNALNHEMWRDELQAWLLSKDSPSVDQLFKNLKYEGHPGLWHLLLFPFAHVTSSPVVMQYIHLIIASLGVYIFLKFSPFNVIQKVSFAFGYFPFYEYCVLSRNYALGLLLSFAFCSLMPKRWERFPLLGLLLFLSSHTSLHALVLVISTCFSLMVEVVLSKKRPDAKIVLGFVIIVFGILTSAIQMIPPSDSGFAVGWKKDFDFNHFKKVFNLISTVFFPIPKFELHFWNTTILDRLIGHDKIRFTLNCLIFVYGIVLFIKKPSALIMYLTGTIGLCVFFYTKYFGYIRHHGFIFICFVVSLWMADRCQSIRLPSLLNKVDSAFSRSSSWILVAIFLIQLVGGVSSVVMEHRYTFSQGKSVSSFIKSEGLKEKFIAGDPDYVVSTVTGYLGREVYYPRGDRIGSFVIWDKKRTESIGIEDVFKRIKDRIGKERSECLIILNYKLNEEMMSKYSLKMVSEFTGSVVADEVYYLYVMK